MAINPMLKRLVEPVGGDVSEIKYSTMLIPARAFGVRGFFNISLKEGVPNHLAKLHINIPQRNLSQTGDLFSIELDTRRGFPGSISERVNKIKWLFTGADAFSSEQVEPAIAAGVATIKFPLGGTGSRQFDLKVDLDKRLFGIEGILTDPYALEAVPFYLLMTPQLAMNVPPRLTILCPTEAILTPARAEDADALPSNIAYFEMKDPSNRTKKVCAVTR